MDHMYNEGEEADDDGMRDGGRAKKKEPKSNSEKSIYLSNLKK